jgi:hypothetical protein
LPVFSRLLPGTGTRFAEEQWCCFLPQWSLSGPTNYYFAPGIFAGCASPVSLPVGAAGGACCEHPLGWQQRSRMGLHAREANCILVHFHVGDVMSCSGPGRESSLGLATGLVARVNGVPARRCDLL